MAAAIDWLGPLPDPTPALRGADLFALPSREEGMSIALLEAMALGMPLVATAIAGNRRARRGPPPRPSRPPDDPPALARTILDQWAHFDQAMILGRAARRVAEHFSSAAVARRHLELFQRLIASDRVAALAAPPLKYRETR